MYKAAYQCIEMKFTNCTCTNNMTI